MVGPLDVPPVIGQDPRNGAEVLRTVDDKEPFSARELLKIKTEVGNRLQELWEWLQQDAHRRLEMPPKSA